MKKRSLQMPAFVLAAALLMTACGNGNKASGQTQEGADGAESAENAESVGSTEEQSLPSEDLTVYSFKAGKADAHLIYNSQFAVLIDCGEKGFGKVITAYLEENSINKLDCLIITHFDKDHVGGAAKVLRSVEVGAVFESNCPKDSEEYAEYTAQLDELGMTAQTVREAVELSEGDAVFTIDPPLQETYEKDPSNNSSLIVSVEYGKNELLFAGDAENDRMSEFVERNTIDYDYLKVPYHGHYQKKLEKFISSVRPEVAVITSSNDEPEDEETLGLLESAGAEVFLTRTAPVKAVCTGETVTAEYISSDEN